MSDEPRQPNGGDSAPSLIDYNSMIQRAMRAVVKDALRLAAEEGLPGDHHFLIELATGADGVEMPASLRGLYPETMRIVLQHQFWNLEAGDEAFSVDLRFGGRMSRLHVPYAAVTAFVDPAAKLGLSFEPEAAAVAAVAETQAEAPQIEAVETAPTGGRVVSFEAFRKGR